MASTYVYRGERQLVFLNLGSCYMETKHYPMPFKLTELQNAFITQTELQREFRDCPSKERRVCIDFDTRSQLVTRYKLSAMQRYMDDNLFCQSTRSVKMFTPRRNEWYVSTFEAFCRMMSSEIPPIQQGWCFFVKI